MKTVQDGNLADYPPGAIKPFVSLGMSTPRRVNKQDVVNIFI